MEGWTWVSLFNYGFKQRHPWVARSQCFVQACLLNRLWLLMSACEFCLFVSSRNVPMVHYSQLAFVNSLTSQVNINICNSEHQVQLLPASIREPTIVMSTLYLMYKICWWWVYIAYWKEYKMRSLQKRKPHLLSNTLGWGCWQLKVLGCHLLVQSVVHIMSFYPSWRFKVASWELELQEYPKLSFIFQPINITITFLFQQPVN